MSKDAIETVTCQTSDQIDQAMEIRRLVFHVEQQIDPTIERDERDQDSDHFLATWEGQPVAASRLVIEGERAKLGRMAVLKDLRRLGIGRKLTDHMEEHARAKGVKTIYLHSQAGARTFYASMGYMETGAPFMEADIPHIMMEKELF